MIRIKQLFFELVQTALGNRTRLSETPSAEEWNVLYEMAREQAIDGVLQAGLEQLPSEQRPYQDLLLEWIGSALIINEQNKLMNKRCLELLKRLEEIGLQASILKGQGIARLYGCLGKLRQPGDIDVYVDSKREEALNVAKNMGLNVESWDYKHAHLEIWEDTEVELHYRVEVMFNLWKNWKLQKWFEAHDDEIFRTSKDSENSNTEDTNLTDGLVTPTVGFNVFYILLHIYRHFFTEGVGLRQIMDYYFVLKTHYDNKTSNLTNYTNGTTDDTDDTDKYCTAVSEFGRSGLRRD